MRIFRHVREALAAAWGTKVSSAVTVVVVAGMVIGVLLTTGRTVGAQQAVLSTLEQQGTRAIIVRAQEDAGIDASVATRLSGVSGIEWTGVFGPTIDSTNVAIGAGGTPVPMRVAYGLDLHTLGVDAYSAVDGVYASPYALKELGMEVPAGALRTLDGVEHSVVGTLVTPPYLEFLEPFALLSVDTGTTSGGSRPVTTIVVIASEALQVSDIATLLRSVLDPSNPDLYTVETSQALAQLQSNIDAQLTGSGRALVAAIFVLTAVLVAAILYAFTTMRRKDFGRRRALGATKSLIVSLVLMQVAVLSVAGSALGSGVSFVVLFASGDPQPPPSYYASVSLLAAATAVLAALLPAVSAALRDPARELRVP